jgi:hypothetical protein
MIGLEIEVPGVARSQLQEFVRRYLDSSCVFEISDDGSIRDTNYGFNDQTHFLSVLPISVGKERILPVGVSALDTRGPEIVTSPYTIETMKVYANQFASALYKIPDTPRASIHGHISEFRDWRHIQNLLRWFYYLEAPLYRLAGFGRRHRGEQRFDGERQDYNYCRPLSNPIGYMKNGRLTPLLDIDKILQADSYAQMLYHWGRLDFWQYDGGLGHYCPHRLHGINIVPLLRQGTVEFRLWNGVYRFLPEVVDIMEALFDLSRDCTVPFSTPMVLGGKYDIDADQVSDILGVKINHIWGKTWPKGCNGLLQSHYRQHNEAISDSYDIFNVSYNN